MKILKMRLENFQGVKELEIDPQGESSAIYGDMDYRIPKA